MKEDYIFVLVGIICILGFVYLLHRVSKHEGFEDIRMDLADGDRGSDAWYEKGGHRAADKKATVIPKNQLLTKSVDEKKAIVKPSQAPATTKAAPAIREVAQVAPVPAPQVAPTPAPQVAPPPAPTPPPQVAPARAPAAQNSPSPAAKREGAPARSAGMPSTVETPVEKTKFNYAPADITPDAGVALDAGKADIGPELTAANTAKPAIPQINSRVNEDMCRVVMNCGLTKL